MVGRSKMFFIRTVFLCIVYSHTCLAVIYHLNDTEYKKMPPVFHVDSYQECMQDPEGMYCQVEVALVSDGQSPLMDLITNYSAHTVGHYNHSLLRYNLCVTNMCKEFYHNTTTDLIQDLEACLNKTFEDSYGLKTKLSENNVHCKKANEEIQTEIADLCMYALLIGILMINTVGSIYDFICTNGKKEDGMFLLTNFSIRRNWRKLVAPPQEERDSRMERLKGLSGIKVILTIIVIIAHATISTLFYIDNTEFVENLYQNIGFKFLASGSFLVVTFLMISGFLLSYNLELMSERNNSEVNWKLIPKRLLLRCIRLTPTYAFVLFCTVTINKYFITGPHWHYFGVAQIVDCQQYWWQHLLYINNYNDESQCMPHTWYLAVDTQLYVLGLFIYVICRSAYSRKMVISLLMVIAIVIPVAQTYWQDLDGMLVSSPEGILRFFLDVPTYANLYKRGHTNMFSSLLGLSIGFLAYYGQKVNFDAQKYRKYRVLFYSIIPLGVVMFLSGCVFYRNGPRPSLAVRMLFAGYQKPVYCLFFGVVLLAVIFKYEGVLRGAVEWGGWKVLSRLSYCAYLLNIPVISFILASNSMTHVTFISVMERMLFVLVVSYLAALPTWMLVEEPAGQLLSSLLRRPETDVTHNTDTSKDKIKEEDKKISSDEQLTRV